ncbi:hypothetical protein SAMN02745704_00559 [Paucidesulfovibrio gracilis DSM 16080]|uniref:Uncharacterized protein n=1 Tax=Paucidesulfovibrio gracilis DSM 16080 TaxID=1121449 RepID=A0A1T4WAG2_9BACT|nr:hypothetical protein [Paucidesulfovibrio gracilis]SKA73935.1 hypothetical protein SAMN02745704_00559 [Paucidesulfovibrio gracilis DSM 16080]
MLIFISLTYHTGIEQQLLSHPAIGEYIYNCTLQSIANAGEKASGVLVSHPVPFKLGKETILLPARKRYEAEINAIQSWDAAQKQTANEHWVVIIRPFLGLFTSHRLLEFRSGLMQQKITHDTESSPIVHSVVPYSQYSNPAWNLRAVPKRFRSGNEIRLPKIKGMVQDQPKDTCHEVYEATKSLGSQRSQDAKTIYYDDEVIYSIRTKKEGNNKINPATSIQIQYNPKSSDTQSLFYRLPLFSLSQNEFPDCTTLEKLCSYWIHKTK